MSADERPDEKILARLMDAALRQSGGGRRWRNAFARAAEMIRSDALMHWTGGSLLVLSESGRVYEAGAACQCEAFRRGRPCKHRAAYRLVRLYNSTNAAP
jgi:photosystem II stability/assembly factor-like uncharacterized protein